MTERDPSTETVTWRGSSALHPHLRPVGELSLHPANPRRGDTAALAGSLNRFGQTKPIVVNPAGVILAGNHTYRAALELGWGKIAAATLELGSEDEELAYVLADNRTGDLGGYDDRALTDALSALVEEGLLEGTGYTPDDLDDLLAQTDVTVTPFEEFKGDYAETEEQQRKRDEALQNAVTRKQTTLLYDPDDYDRFVAAVKQLAKHYDTNGTTAVWRVVTETAATLATESPAEPTPTVTEPGGSADDEAVGGLA